MRAGRRPADALIAVEPEAELGEHVRRRAAGPASRAIGQIPICWGPDKDAAVDARARAVPLVRRRLEGQRRPARDRRASPRRRQFVRPEDVADEIPCGPDLDAVRRGRARVRDAGFTDVALVQIGDEHQQPFLEWSEQTLMPAWREAFGG